MATSPTRALTLQEKIQRKRRNKTPTASPEEAPRAPSRIQKQSSPHKIQIKNQLAKAMGTPSESISPPSIENRPAQPTPPSRKADEQIYPLQEVESPLDSTENKRDIHSPQRRSSDKQNSRRTGVQEESTNERKEMLLSDQRPKTPTRNNLPKWPPQQVTSVRGQEQKASWIRPVEKEEANTPTTVEKVDCCTQTSPLEEQQPAAGKVPSWKRTSPIVSNNFVNNGKPSWVRNFENEKQTQSEVTLSPLISQQEASWTRSRTPSPATHITGSVSERQASSVQTVGTERTPSPAPSAEVSSQSSQQKIPWARPATERTPSPAPNYGNGGGTQQNVTWPRQRVPSPSRADFSSQGSQQKAPWIRPRTPSPGPNNADAVSQQRAPWARSRTPSPSPGSANGNGQQRAPWVRPVATERVPSPAGAANANNQLEATETRMASPRRKIETREHVFKRREAELKSRLVEVLDEMEIESVPTEKNISMSKPSAQPNMFTSQSQETKPRKRWPPVRTEPYSNAYKEQRAIVKNVEEECSMSATKTMHVEEEPSEPAQPITRATSPQQASLARNVGGKEDDFASMASEQVHAEAVKRAPWLRTSPAGLTSDKITTGTHLRAETAEPEAIQQTKSWDRRSPLSVPTDEGNQFSMCWAQQPSRARSSSPAPNTIDEASQRKASWNVHVANAGTVTAMLQDRSTNASKVIIPSRALKDSDDVPPNSNAAKQQVTARSYKKPPPSPHFGTSNYLPPWVKAKESKSNADASLKKECEQSTSKTLDLQANLVSAPSDEMCIASPPSTWSGREQSIQSQVLPSSKILKEVKTRHEPLKRSNSFEEAGSESAARAFFSYGGAVIETPNSVNVASLRSAFTSGGSAPSPRSKSAPPRNRSSWRDREALPIETENKGPPHTSNRTSPGETIPHQRSRPSWKSRDNAYEDSGPVQPPEPSTTNRKAREKWGQVHSQPPAWSKSAFSNRDTSQVELRTTRSPNRSSRTATSQRQAAPARSSPPTSIIRNNAHGNKSSIRSPQWGSKPTQSHEPASLNRSPPPSWVNRDISQGEISSIRSPVWDSTRGPAPSGEGAAIAESSAPLLWVNREISEEELSPIESPQPSPLLRTTKRPERGPPAQMVAKERMTVETVGDDSSVEDDVNRERSENAAAHVELDRVEYLAEDEASVGIHREDTGERWTKETRATEQDAFKQHEYDEIDEGDQEVTDHYPKSPSKSLVQMAMDSVFALDFDLLMAQAPKAASFDDDEETAGSSPSKGIVKSTPPERELPEEVKAMLKMSLNRTMSDSRPHDDSRAYEAGYFSTDVSSSAIDRTGSAWRQNDISALSHGSGLQQLSPTKTNTGRSSSALPQTPSALNISDKSPVNKPESIAVPDETLERIREMKLTDEPKGGSEAVSSSAVFGNPNTYISTGGGVEGQAPTISKRAQATEEWHEGHGAIGMKREEPSSTRESSFFNSVNPGNEATIDFGNPTDVSIQVSPESPRQTSLVGTSPALLSDSPSEILGGRKTVRFGHPKSYLAAGGDYERELQPSVSDRRRAFEKWQDENVRVIPAPPPEQDISPPSAGARHILRHFVKDKNDETEELTAEASLLKNSEDWNQFDPDLNDIQPEPAEATSVDWHFKPPPPPRVSSPNNGVTWSRGFDGPDPFSTQDRDDPFMKQDDPFATSKSVSSDFSADFKGVFDPFSDTDAFDLFAEPASNGFFSPYGDAPMANNVVMQKPSKLTPSRRVRRRRPSSAELYDEHDAQQATRFGPASTSKEDDYDEYFVQQATYIPSTSTDVGSKDGTYLLEI